MYLSVEAEYLALAASTCQVEIHKQWQKLSIEDNLGLQDDSWKSAKRNIRILR